MIHQLRSLGRIDGGPEAGLRVSDSAPAMFEREVLPHVPDAWIHESKITFGDEIPLNRHFHRYEPPRPLDVIEADIKALEDDIEGMLGEVRS